MKILNIKFRKTKKVYPFLINDEKNYKKGDHVIVDTIRGEQIGIVLGTTDKRLEEDNEDRDEVKIREVKRKLSDSEVEKLKDLDVTVVTNGLMHLEELMKYKIKTVVLGGEIKGQTGAIVGVEAINFISKYRFDKCFLGTNGISLDTGFTTPEVNEAYLKKKAIELSEESFVLADKRKFNRVSNINFSSFKECKIITSKEAIKENNRYKKYFY